MLQRLGEAVGQVVTRGLNDLDVRVQQAVIAALDSGDAKLRLVILTPGIEIHAQLVFPESGEVVKLFEVRA
jgi:hypothetical protein